MSRTIPPAPVEPAVVLLPGLGLDARAWTLVRADLGRASQVVLLPSMGRRAGRKTDFGVETQAGRLLDALADAAVSSVVLVGHSASCAVAVEAACRSHSVVGLVLVGPVTDPRARSWPRMLGQWLRTATHEQLRELPVLAPQYLRTGLLTMLRGMDAVRRYRTHHGLDRVDVPVVVIRGGREAIGRWDWTERLVSRPGRRLDTVDGAAHMVPLTHPHTVTRAIRDVGAAAVRRCEPSRRTTS